LVVVVGGGVEGKRKGESNDRRSVTSSPTLG
jgi:hypothetical protein